MSLWQALASRLRRRMRVVCVMMQKNETDLLRPWVVHHADLFGIENLYVFDNGSTDEQTLDLLRKFEAEGLNVDYSHSSRADFENKGKIVSDKIREIDAKGDVDFFFPLDCDEFVARTLDNGRVVLGRNEILAGLKPFRDDPRVLMIQGAYANNPNHPDYYDPNPQLKSFFARGACLSLGMGFHGGRAVTTSKRARTSISYIHFHFRPYRSYQYFSRQKLEGRIESFETEELKNFKGKGHHLVGMLLMTEDQYANAHPRARNVHLPDFNARMLKLGAPIVWSEPPQ